MKNLLAQIKAPGYDPIVAPSGVPQLGSGPNGVTLSRIIGWAVSVAIVAGILAAIVFFVYGGYKWITSGGDKQKIDSARKTITYTIIGLVLMVLSLVIVKFMGDVFGVKYF